MNFTDQEKFAIYAAWEALYSDYKTIKKDIPLFNDDNKIKLETYKDCLLLLQGIMNNKLQMNIEFKEIV